MQLVIKVDLNKAKRSLPEIFKLVADEVREEATLGAEGTIHDDRSHPIGEWEIEDDEKNRPQPLDSRYRSAAIAKYVRPGQIEVDRFASVSPAEDGAYVEGWLFVPESDVDAPTFDAIPPRKPPQSISSAQNTGRKAV